MLFTPPSNVTISPKHLQNTTEIMRCWRLKCPILHYQHPRLHPEMSRMLDFMGNMLCQSNALEQPSRMTSPSVHQQRCGRLHRYRISFSKSRSRPWPANSKSPECIRRARKYAQKGPILQHHKILWKLKICAAPRIPKQQK